MMLLKRNRFIVATEKRSDIFVSILNLKSFLSFLKSATFVYFDIYHLVVFWHTTLRDKSAEYIQHLGDIVSTTYNTKVT